MSARHRTLGSVRRIPGFLVVALSMTFLSVEVRGQEYVIGDQRQHPSVADAYKDWWHLRVNLKVAYTNTGDLKVPGALDFGSKILMNHPDTAIDDKVGVNGTVGVIISHPIVPVDPATRFPGESMVPRRGSGIPWEQLIVVVALSAVVSVALTLIMARLLSGGPRA